MYPVDVVSLVLGKSGSFVDGYYIPHPVWELANIGTVSHKTYMRTYDNKAVTDVIYQIHVSHEVVFHVTLIRFVESRNANSLFSHVGFARMEVVVNLNNLHTC